MTSKRRGATDPASKPRQRMTVGSVGPAPSPKRRMCNVCGIRPEQTAVRLTEMCAPCYDLAGWDNEHSDNDHEATPNPECWVCHPELAMEAIAPKPVKNKTMSSFVRHPHTSCAHPRTPKERDICRRTHRWNAETNTWKEIGS